MTERTEFDETRNRRRERAAIAAAMRSFAGPVDGHPPYEEIATVVDGSADEVTREIVTSHMEVCTSCAAELNDLRAFSGLARRRLWRPIWLASTAAVVAAALILTEAVTHPRETAPHPAVVRMKVDDGWQRLAAASLQAGRAEVPADIHALAVGDAYRGGDPVNGDRIVVSPAGTVIDDLQPRFRWTGFPADTYEVEMYEEGRPFARSELQRDTAWVCPRPLVRGKSYRWQVVAHRGEGSFIIPSPPAPPAIFRVLGAQEHEELARAVARHAGDDLLLGVLYAHLGMMEPAREHLASYATRTRSAASQRLAASIDFAR